MKNQLSSEFKNVSVSSGTMVTEDLAETFLDVLVGKVCQKVMSQEQKRLVSEIREEVAEIVKRGEACNYHSCGKHITDDKDQESLSWLVSKLFDILDQIAPKYCYFGAHQGDGSDYGFWEIDEDYI